MPNEELLEFIHRRFPTEDRWLNGNCYWFAQILNHWFEVNYPNKIHYLVYDVIYGHFYLYADGYYYDWRSRYSTLPEDTFPVKWNDFKEYDAAQYERVRKDCIL